MPRGKRWCSADADACAAYAADGERPTAAEDGRSAAGLQHPQAADAVERAIRPRRTAGERAAHGAAAQDAGAAAAQGHVHDGAGCLAALRGVSPW
jgi:hypothetical protein